LLLQIIIVSPSINKSYEHSSANKHRQEKLKAKKKNKNKGSKPNNLTKQYSNLQKKKKKKKKT